MFVAEISELLQEFHRCGIEAAFTLYWLDHNCGHVAGRDVGAKQTLQSLHGIGHGNAVILDREGCMV